MHDGPFKSDHICSGRIKDRLRDVQNLERSFRGEEFYYFPDCVRIALEQEAAVIESASL